MLFLQPALPERRPPAPNAWGLSLVSKTLGLHPKVEGAKPSDSTIFQLNICPCSSKAERSPCKRQVAGALPRLGLHFSAAPAEAIAALIAAIYAHVVYWMGNVPLKRLKQVRFLPCVWCAIAQLVERPPVKWIVPGSSPGSAAIFHYRLTVRHSAHDWSDVGANPASGTIFRRCNLFCKITFRKYFALFCRCVMLKTVEKYRKLFPMKVVLQHSDRQMSGSQPCWSPSDAGANTCANICLLNVSGALRNETSTNISPRII